MTSLSTTSQAPPGSIIQRAAVLRGRQALALDDRSTNIVNLARDDGPLRTFIQQDVLGTPRNQVLFASEAVRGLGAPAARVRASRGLLGVWLFDDTPTGLTFLVWSDGYKKRRLVAGTSHHVIVTPGALPMVKEAYARLIDHLWQRLPDDLKALALDS